VDRRLAEQVLDFLILANGALNGAYRALHHAASSDDYAEEKKRIATLVALLGTGIMRQIHKEHPDLCPAALRETLDLKIAPELEWPLP
jgi:hypothetical protein